ncbi:HIT family protein [Planomicrobium sp. CPCC 101079]|uniref:HIT family protein n=1 Tax=Planomicrobium sp. CPCC 101079 TaxID=2599618 RepID=UPI0011B7E658|nr:HIT family protein [Planomicrobium sp. CPCC 101079]TWT13173.1 HIT family protein [Planomicrobium sp. CPCC 101079]
MDITCLGCSLANKELPVNVVYENDYVTCILDHDPFNEGHTLILPKKHFRYVDEFDTETAIAVLKASQLLTKVIKKLYDPYGITICQNGGGVDDLTHYHMHVVPRKENQDFSSFFNDEIWENDHLKKKLSITRNELIIALMAQLSPQT